MDLLPYNFAISVPYIDLTLKAPFIIVADDILKIFF